MGLDHDLQKKISVGSHVDINQRPRIFDGFSPPLQPKSEEEETPLPDLDAQMQRANRFGHSLSNVNVNTPAPHAMLQRQIHVQREVVEEEREKDAEMQMKKRLQLKSDRELLMPLLQQAPAKDLTAKDSGQPLPKGVQRKMEKSFGSSFSDVRVHEGNQAKSVGALAYTQGSHIHFAPGRYQPDSPSGQALLGHELTHVVQQRAGRVPIPSQSKGMPINADPSLEQEADVMGAKAARGETAVFQGSGAPELPLRRQREPMQNSTQPVQMFFIGMVLKAVLPKILEMLFPDQGGGGGGGGGGGESEGGGGGGGDA